MEEPHDNCARGSCCARIKPAGRAGADHHDCHPTELHLVRHSETLTPEQRSQAAERFGAEDDYLSAGKKLIDTKHPAFRAVTAVRGRTMAYWKGISLPFPEPGIRLIRQDDLPAVDVQLTSLKVELDEVVWRLDEHLEELKSAAAQRLGRLWNAGDYPEALRGLFEVSWDFPSVEPPPYLQQLSPALYQQKCQRVAARFDEAVRLVEQAFLEELVRASVRTPTTVAAM